MKILHVTNTVTVGGAETALLALCRQHREAGLDLTVACLREYAGGPRSLRHEFERVGVAVRDLDRARGDPFCVWDLGAVVRQERPDILHTHLPRSDIAGVIARGRKPIPRVVTVHGAYGAHGLWRLLLPALAGVWRTADAVLAPSNAVRLWLARACGVRSERVRVVHNGVEVEQYASARRDLRTEWGMDARPTIGAVGRIEPDKGHDLLVRGMQSVLREFPDALLLIAGTGAPRHLRSLVGLVRRLGLAESVRLVGFQEDICSFLHAVDVFACGSRLEGFGLAVAEAMAAGKPVVAARIPPMDEVVQDGETGLLVAPESPEAFGRAITALLRDTSAALRMGRAGHLRAALRFTSARMAAEILAAYHAVLRGTG